MHGKTQTIREKGREMKTKKGKIERQGAKERPDVFVKYLSRVFVGVLFQLEVQLQNLHCKQTKQNINNPPLKEVMAASARSEGDFVLVMAVTRTCVET